MLDIEHLGAVRGCVEIRASHYKYQDLARIRGAFYCHYKSHSLQSGFEMAYTLHGIA